VRAAEAADLVERGDEPDRRGGSHARHRHEPSRERTRLRRRGELPVGLGQFLREHVDHPQLPVPIDRQCGVGARRADPCGDR